ncbi:MAG: Uma2 family endonuclease, partial [Gemmataceae bacterium]|nr:Uma2 family endonuclease [Gemmataceae bacterium]
MTVKTTAPALEPLREGERVTRDEFERRYHAMPDVKAELIEGVVRMTSPVRIRLHGNPHAYLATWLVHYEMETPGTLSGLNATARLDVINEPQPDGMILIEPECGGQARISSDDYVEHAPEFVAEVAASTAPTDIGIKREVYRKTGALEYLLWRVERKAIDWFVLRDEAFEPLVPGPDGLLRSEALPGLWLDPAALVAGDVRRVLEALALGI